MNRSKIVATINNAKIFREIVNEFGSFYNYLKSFTSTSVIYEIGITSSDLSDAISKDLKKRHMKYVGTTIIYSFLQAIGMVYSHERDCFLYKKIKKLFGGNMVRNYKVITLCGSTRFKDVFLRVQKELTLQGNIVISVGLFGHSGDAEVWENMDEGTLTKTKEMLDDMHKRKIDMADEIFVINVGGYIGDSTKSEIEYAKSTNKKVNFLEP